jgi:endonuclease/exonuclease/phosphatase family metal-dependent hydrolase
MQRQTLRVLQFNCLSEIYEPSHLHPTLCAFAQGRASRIEASIRHVNPDVACLQETNPAEWFGATFLADYDILFGMKGDVADSFQTPEALRVLRRDGRNDDGAMLMLKRSTVRVLAAKQLSAFEPASRSAPSPVSTFPARQFALAAACEHRTTGKRFVVAGMHMKAGMDGQPDCHKDVQRVCHASQILAALKAFRDTTCPEGPIVFTGDFNAKPEMATLAYLLGHSPAWAAPLIAPLSFESGMCKALGREPDFTILVSSNSPGVGWSATLDYIMLEKGCFAIAGATEPPAMGADPLTTSWGNDALPFVGSDHIPLALDLAFV